MSVAILRDENSLTKVTTLLVGPDMSSPEAQMASALSHASDVKGANAAALRSEASQWKGIASSLKHLNNLETASGTALNAVDSANPKSSGSPGGSTAVGALPWNKVAPKFTTTIAGGHPVTVFVPPTEP